MPQSSKDAITPVVSIRDASLRLGGKTVWENVTFDVRPGEFIAILGPNGAGKTTLLKSILGLLPLASGTISLSNELETDKRRTIGFVPQHQGFDASLPVRGRDLVELGFNGAAYGFLASGSKARDAVTAALRSVKATSFAHKPIGQLSGGQQQRLRIAQALVTNPRLLLCDEPFLSLDLPAQQLVSDEIARRGHEQGMATLFVTHDLTPAIIPMVDRVMYIVNGRWSIGTPSELLTTKALSELYGIPVEVVRLKNRIMVIASETAGTQTDTTEHTQGRS